VKLFDLFQLEHEGFLSLARFFEDVVELGLGANVLPAASAAATGRIGSALLFEDHESRDRFFGQSRITDQVDYRIASSFRDYCSHLPVVQRGSCFQGHLLQFGDSVAPEMRGCLYFLIHYLPQAQFAWPDIRF